MTDPKGSESQWSDVAFPQGLFEDASPYTTLLMEWHNELAAHYVLRLQSYMALPMRLAMCTSPGDLTDVQLTFNRRLVEDYRTVAGRLSKIANRNEASPEPDEVAEYSEKILKAQEDAKEIIRLAKVQAARIVEGAERAANAAEQPEDGTTQAA